MQLLHQILAMEASLPTWQYWEDHFKEAAPDCEVQAG